MKTDDYFQGLKNKNRAILGQAITLIESSLPNDSILKDNLLEKCIPHSGTSMRIGVSGSPGVGKSTFIEKLGLLLLKKKKKIAVLAIDPSSSVSQGSILGDKTRMTALTNNDNVFIRPSPNRGSLGGICESTQDTITLCEASGYDIVIVETVGVGQSETIAESITDVFIYLTLTENGDEIQFIKKGIIELSDLIIINKSDQDIKKANQTKMILEHNINLSHHKLKSVFTCSSLHNQNIDVIWNHIIDLYKKRNNNGTLIKKRKQQRFSWVQEIIINKIKNQIINDDEIQSLIIKYENKSNHSIRKIAEKIIKKLLK